MSRWQRIFRSKGRHSHVCLGLCKHVICKRKEEYFDQDAKPNAKEKNYHKGYVLNEKRLKEQQTQLSQLKQTVKLLGNVIERQSISSDEATGLLKVITDYTYALDVLDQYDHQVLEIHDTTKDELYRINYAEAMQAMVNTCFRAWKKRRLIFYIL